MLDHRRSLIILFPNREEMLIFHVFREIRAGKRGTGCPNLGSVVREDSLRSEYVQSSEG